MLFRSLPAGDMYVASSTIAYPHWITLHLQCLLSRPVATSSREKHSSHLGRCEDVSPDGIARTGVSLTYFSAHGSIEERHQLECRVHEYEVSIRDEEGGCARELALPEEVDFAVGGDEVLEEDEYWESAAVSIVPRM